MSEKDNGSQDPNISDTEEVGEEQLSEIFGEANPDFEELAEDIETVVDQKPFYDRVLPELYKDHLNGEDIIDPLDSVIRDTIEVARLTSFFARLKIDSEKAVVMITNEACEQGDISESVRDAFQTFWKEHSWLEEAVSALLQREEGYMYPTGQGLTVEYVDQGDPEFVSDWQAIHGVDDLWNMTLPTQELIRLMAITTRFTDDELNRFLDNSGGTVGLGQDELEEMRDAADELLDNAKSFQKSVDRLEEYTIDEMDDYRQFEQEFDQSAPEDLDDDLPDYEL